MYVKTLKIHKAKISTSKRDKFTVILEDYKTLFSVSNRIKNKVYKGFENIN